MLITSEHFDQRLLVMGIGEELFLRFHCSGTCSRWLTAKILWAVWAQYHFWLPCRKINSTSSCFSWLYVDKNGMQSRNLACMEGAKVRVNRLMWLDRTVSSAQWIYNKFSGFIKISSYIYNLWVFYLNLAKPEFVNSPSTR